VTIFAGALALHNRCIGVAAINGTEQIHADDEIEQCRVD
jgi:hypothetical protein